MFCLQSDNIDQQFRYSSSSICTDPWGEWSLSICFNDYCTLALFFVFSSTLKKEQRQILVHFLSERFSGFFFLIFDARWRKNSRTESGRCSFNASVFCGEHGRLLIKQTFSKWCDWWGVNGDAFIAARSTKRGELARSEVEKNPDCFVFYLSFFFFKHTSCKMASLPKNMYTSLNRKSESWLQVCFLWDDYRKTTSNSIRNDAKTQRW